MKLGPMNIGRNSRLEDLPELPSPVEVATYLGCSKGAVYTLVKTRVLPAVRIGKLIRIPRTALAEFVAPKSEVPASFRRRVG